MSPSRKRKPNQTKQNRSSARERYTNEMGGFASKYSRPRQRIESSSDNELGPLDKAQEIQNECNGRKSSRNREYRRRENHKKPDRVKSPFSPPSHFSDPAYVNRILGSNKRRRGSHSSNEIGTSYKKDYAEDVATSVQSTRKQKKLQTVDLCTSNSDTDYDSDSKTLSTRSPPPLSSKALKSVTRSCGSNSESEGKKKLRKDIETKKRRQLASVPKYPSCLSVSTNHTQDQNDDENNSVITQNDTSSSIIDLEEKKVENVDGYGYGGEKVRSKKKREESQGGFETNAKQCVEKNDEQVFKKKSKTLEFEPIVRSCIEKTEERIPRKKTSSTLSLIRVPAIKPIFQRKEKKKKSLKRARRQDDVKDMDCRSDDDNEEYLTAMNNVVELCMNGNDEEQGLNSISRTTDNALLSIKDISVPIAGSSTLSQSPSRSLKNMKKMNIKGSRAKTKGRKKPKVIVPGTSLTQRKDRQQQNNDQLNWRNEIDQDEYHTSNKETKDDGSLRWDPINGGNYRNTRSSTTRRSNQYGTSTGQWEDWTDSSSRRRSKRSKKQKKPETIDILSSDSEDDDVIIAQEEEEEECDVIKFPLKRLAVGEKMVYNNQDHQPMIIFNTEKFTMELHYSKSKIVDNRREKINIDMKDVEEFCFWTSNDSTRGLGVDYDSFIFVRGDISKGDVEMKSAEKTKDLMKKSQKFVLEFEEDQHLHDILDAAMDCPGKNYKPFNVDPNDAEDLTESLISDSMKKYKRRSRNIHSEIDPFIVNRQNDEILVVFPFKMDKNEIASAADGLKELSWTEVAEGENQDSVESNNDNASDSATYAAVNESSENTLTTIQNGQRSHFIEIRVEDYNKLDTGQWLNDSLVDMWMQWISRDVICKHSSNFHFFTSHFYTTLASEGIVGVKSWTIKKNINIFEKRLIFIPINKTLHWSLCVVVNPGAIISSVDDEDGNNWKDRPLPCMLFFDSLNMHRKARVHNNVVKWLNSEWKRMKGPNQDPFTKTSCKIYDPPVPRQNNGSDCGVFVCRYAFAMFQLRHLKFSHRDAGLVKIEHRQNRTRRQSDARPLQVFSELITNGENFDFNVHDIQRIRCEFKTLIKNLHGPYQTVKKERIKTEKEEKIARKRRKEKAIESAPSSIQKLTKSVESNVDETESAMVVLNISDAPGGSVNETSDSSKENRIPRQDQEKLAQEKRWSDGEERYPRFGPLTLEATQQQSSLETPGTDGRLRQNSREDDTGDIATNNEKIEPTQYVEKEEMANTEGIVHF